jgi:predicted DCC family thiol-disulfide oxidoreductase YuxK
MTNPVIFYDGICGLCNRMVRFILKRDPQALFRFAALQSPLATRILERHGVNPSILDTFYVVLNHDTEQGKQSQDTLLARSDAILFVLKQLGGIWRIVGGILKILPRTFRDWIYRVIARNRYQTFGRYETCPTPDAATRARFLDI